LPKYIFIPNGSLSKWLPEWFKNKFSDSFAAIQLVLASFCLATSLAISQWQ
jgi:hypothetical protein